MNINDLILLYLKNQDLKGKTPEEIYKLYKQAEKDFKEIDKKEQQDKPKRKYLGEN